MSVTLIHIGHIKLLAKAKTLGYVIVALTTDEEIKKKKGYDPELDFQSRKEILESIKYVDKVIASPWLITEEFLNENNADFLLHGDDNQNPINEKRLIILPRTPNVSSTILRAKSKQNYDLQNVKS